MKIHIKRIGVLMLLFVAIIMLMPIKSMAAAPVNGEKYYQGDYEYSYNQYWCERPFKWENNPTQNGWGARVISKDKTTYSPILENINGKPVNYVTEMFMNCRKLVSAPIIPNSVINMNDAFTECNSLAKPPVIPESVISMAGTFSHCTNLITAPLIPNSVTDISFIFYNCPNLRGEIIIKANPTIFYDSFSRTATGNGLKIICDNTNIANITKAVATQTTGNVSLVNIDTVPTTNGSKVTIGDYEYSYNQYWDYDLWADNTAQNGWGVRTLDKAKSSYGEILSIIGGKPVKNMNHTFNGCSSLVTPPAIPKSITYMSLTFARCSKLNGKVIIPETVTNMNGTFNGCTSLTTAPAIPNSVTNINNTFQDCTSLINAPAIPKSVITMHGTFYGCANLATAPVIPDGVTNMLGTFNGCSSLVNAPVIPNGVTDMSWIFANCSKLNGKVIIPETVTNMNGSFFCCSSMENTPNIPSQVTSLDSTFRGCDSMKEAPVLHNGITNLNGSFWDCKSIVKMPEIPNGVTTMLNAFVNCKSLETATTIPSSVTNLESAFRLCPKLNGVMTVNSNPTAYNTTFDGGSVSSPNSLLVVCNNLNKENITKMVATQTSGNISVFNRDTINVGTTIISGDYEYSYNQYWNNSAWVNNIAQNGWGVRVVDKTKTVYGEMLDTIANFPVVSIKNTFAYCKQLTKAPNIPQGIVDMTNAFMGCDNLVSVSIIPSSITILENSFKDCYKLSGFIQINSNASSYNSLFNGAVITPNKLIVFCNTDNLANAEKMVATQTTGNISLVNKESLETGTKIISGDYEYSNNQYWNGSLWETYSSQNGWGVRVLDKTKAGYGEIISTIANIPVNTLVNTFNDCINLIKSPEIPNSITDMRNSFNGCINLEEVATIPENVKCVQGTFINCKKLNGLLHIVSDAPVYLDMFSGTTINPNKLIVSHNSNNMESVTKMVSTQTTGNITMLNVGTIVDGTKITIGDYEYAYNQDVNNDSWSNNPGLAGWGVRVLDKTKTAYGEIESKIGGKPIKSVKNTFNGCANLINAPEIPASVVAMDYAFANCTALVTGSKIPYGVLSLWGTYEGCISLINAPDIPDSVTDMVFTFKNCSKLVIAPSIGNSVNRMYATFWGCSKLIKTPEIPNSMKDMYTAFYQCYALETASTIPENVTTTSWVFGGCTNLRGKIVIKANPTTLDNTFGGNAVANPNKLTVICDNSNVAAVTQVVATQTTNNISLLNTDTVSTANGSKITTGDYEYSYNQYWNNTAWVNDTAQNGWGVRVLDKTKTAYGEILSTIGGKPVVNMCGTFWGCINLTDAPVIPSGVKNMNGTFQGCSKLNNGPTLPNGVTTINGIFAGCEKMAFSPVIPSSVISMEGAYSGCQGIIIAPVLPSGITNLDSAFLGCTNLISTPEIPNGVVSLNSTFLGCENLAEAAVLPVSVKSLNSTYYGCSSLVNAPNIPSGVTDMHRTFGNCHSLVKPPENIPATVTDISETFVNCTKIVGIMEFAPISLPADGYTDCFNNTSVGPSYFEIKPIDENDASANSLLVDEIIKTRTTEFVVKYPADNTPPTLPIFEATFADNTPYVGGTWTNKDVTVKVGGSTAISGITKYQISTDKGVTWTDYVVGSTGIVYSQKTEIMAKAISGVGLISEISTITINIAKKAPTATITINPLSWTNKEVTITAEGKSEEGCPIVQIAALFGYNQNWVTGAITKGSVLQNGTYQFKIQDAAGNIGYESVVVSTIDKDAPTGTITGNVTNWTKNDVTLVFNANDILSGVEFVSVNGGEWKAGSNISFIVTSNQTVSFSAKDRAGNIKEFSEQVKFIDKAVPNRPVIKATHKFGKALDSDIWTNSNVIVQFSGGANTISGLDHYVYYLNGSTTGTDINWESNLELSTEGIFSIQVEAISVSGAVSEKSPAFKVKIDKLMPTASYTIIPETGWALSAQVTVLGDDNVSGIKEIRCMDKVSNTQNLLFTTSHSGIHTLEVEDNAGNIYSVDINITTVDDKDPIIVSINIPTEVAYPVIATINAIDRQSGIKEYGISKTNSEPTVWQASPIFNITENGTYYGWAKDNVGRKISKVFVVTTVDETIPEDPVIIAMAGGTKLLKNGEWTNKDVEYSFKGGVKTDHYVYYLNGSTTGITAPINFKQTIAQESVTSIKIKAVGTNGQESALSEPFYIKIDKTAPLFTYKGIPTKWVSEALLEFTINERGGSLTKGLTVHTPANEEIFVDAPYRYTARKGGNYTFTVSDNAGNSTTQTVNIHYIDSEKPIITVRVEYKKDKTTAEIIVTATDAGTSGIHHVIMPDKTAMEQVQFRYEVNLNAEYAFFAVDNAGNMSEKVIAKVIDIKPSEDTGLLVSITDSNIDNFLINNSPTTINLPVTGLTGAKVYFTAAQEQGVIESVNTATVNKTGIHYDLTIGVNEEKLYTVIVKSKGGNRKTYLVTLTTKEDTPFVTIANKSKILSSIYGKSGYLFNSTIINYKNSATEKQGIVIEVNSDFTNKGYIATGNVTFEGINYRVRWDSIDGSTDKITDGNSIKGYAFIPATSLQDNKEASLITTTLSVTFGNSKIGSIKTGTDTAKISYDTKGPDVTLNITADNMCKISASDATGVKTILYKNKKEGQAYQKEYISYVGGIPLEKLTKYSFSVLSTDRLNNESIKEIQKTTSNISSGGDISQGGEYITSQSAVRYYKTPSAYYYLFNARPSDNKEVINNFGYIPVENI